jgi:RNA polymerase sigma-70 factor (ECF subfamily)
MKNPTHINCGEERNASGPTRARTEQDIVDLIPTLRAFARSLTRNEIDADDLVQETLLKALSNLEKFEPGTMLRAWLFTIMRNAFYTTVRKAGRSELGEGDCASHMAVSQPPQEWALRGGEVLAAIEKLPRHFRETLVLVSMMGESYESAASILGCSIGTVKSRIHRARHLVSETLGGQPLD